MIRCCFCGAAISTNHEVEIVDPDRRRIAATFFKGQTHFHTDCLRRYERDAIVEKLQREFREAGYGTDLQDEGT